MDHPRDSERQSLVDEIASSMRRIGDSHDATKWLSRMDLVSLRLLKSTLIGAEARMQRSAEVKAFVQRLWESTTLR